jgi:Flp pilus assembly protein TadD
MSRSAHVEAIAYLSRAVSLDPGSWLACTSLGRAYEQNGNIALSIGQYRECLTMSRSQHMDAEVVSLEKTIKELNDRVGDNQAQR